MSVAVITGSSGLIGSEAARHFGETGHLVVGIDNDLRATFFGPDASTLPVRARIQSELGDRYRHVDVDIRSKEKIDDIFKQYGGDVSLVIHAAAQPSHDWAAKDPQTDFTVNANGTLNLLEATRRYAPDAVFIFTSTNKVYGDAPNSLPFIEQSTRWELPLEHELHGGIPESFPMAQSLLTLFGASKVAADVLVQEYGRFFGLKSACFRGGCLTGPAHAGAELHGFLAYLMKCVATGRPYRVLGYKGKQVRDNIHSADVVAAFEAFYQAPRRGEVYNLGGGRDSNCSMLEAIDMSEQIAGRSLDWSYVDENRVGDYMWWISDLARFRSHFPEWTLKHEIGDILMEIYEAHSS